MSEQVNIVASRDALLRAIEPVVGNAGHAHSVVAHLFLSGVVEDGDAYFVRRLRELAEDRSLVWLIGDATREDLRWLAEYIEGQS